MKSLVAPPFRVGMSGEKRLTGFSPDNVIKDGGRMDFITWCTKDLHKGHKAILIAGKSLAYSVSV
jgi:hypothetical protein